MSATIAKQNKKDSDAPLSVSCLPFDTMTGTYHTEGSFSSTSSPCIARFIASSFPSGGGGTCGSHAMLTKTLRPFGTGIGLGAGSRRFDDFDDFGEGGGGRTVGARDDDFMQKPAFGAKSMRTVEEDMSRHVTTRVYCSYSTYSSRYIEMLILISFSYNDAQF